jgi:hypothetical protein
MFGTDRTLLYNVSPWAELGFGVPNFGENETTLNAPIARLFDEIGKAQLYIMTHPDAMRWKPPSRNTVERIGKLIMRVQSVLGSRKREYSDRRLEGVHASPALQVFTIHPVPFFGSDIVRNPFLSEYNGLVMVALANMAQHSDNNLPLTITGDFASAVWQWFKEIKINMGVELLQLKPELVEDDAFLFKPEHYDAYDPMNVVLDMEAADTPSLIEGLPTEDDLRLLFKGIPASQLRGLLVQAPVGPGGGPIAGAKEAGGFTSGVAPATTVDPSKNVGVGGPGTTTDKATSGLPIGELRI